MHIGYISFENPCDIVNWSGTHFSIFNTLKKEYDVEWVMPSGLHNLRYGVERFFRNKEMIAFNNWLNWKVINLMYRLQGMSFSELLHKDYAWYYSTAFAKDMSKSMQKNIGKNKYDILFAPRATAEIAFLNTDIPIVYLHDCTFTGVVDYLIQMSNLTDRNIEEGNIIQSNAINIASQIIYSSSWAADSAINYYGAVPEKLNIIHFGANLQQIPNKIGLKCGSDNKVKLLFISVNWENKGGDIAVETLNILNKRGIPTELIIIGCNPRLNQENIKIIPFLNKNNEQDLRLLMSYYQQSDFMILPSRAECAGIVFCEASAFGIPSIATDTGGIPDYVENNINGYRLPFEAKGAEYAEVIRDIFSDKERYQSLRESSRIKYERDLNWDIWLDKFKEVIKKI
jgi:glycosyltransferase involved in cell wall biosynthesis